MSAAPMEIAKLLPLILYCFILHSTFVQQTNSTLTSPDTMSNKRDSLENAKDAQIPDYLYELYDNVQKYGFGNCTKNKIAENVNVIRHHYGYDEDGYECENYPENGFTLKFNLTNVPLEEAMRASELSVYLGPSMTDEELIGDVYDVLEPPTTSSPKPTLRLIDTTTVNAGNMTSQWLSFDVMAAVSRAMQQTGDKIVHLYVEVRTTPKKSDLKVEKSSIVNNDQHRAYLLTFTDDGSGDSLTTPPNEKQVSSFMSSQTRRSIKGGLKEGSHCRRHPLYVKFADIGWNKWIAAPSGYKAYYCGGDCASVGNRSTNHAIIQDLVHSVDSEAAPKACCYPTDMSPLSVLYLDESKGMTLRKYSNMVVESCGCR